MANYLVNWIKNAISYVYNQKIKTLEEICIELEEIKEHTQFLLIAIRTEIKRKENESLS